MLHTFPIVSSWSCSSSSTDVSNLGLSNSLTSPSRKARLRCISGHQIRPSSEVHPSAFRSLLPSREISGISPLGHVLTLGFRVCWRCYCNCCSAISSASVGLARPGWRHLAGVLEPSAASLDAVHAITISLLEAHTYLQKLQKLQLTRHSFDRGDTPCRRRPSTQRQAGGNPLESLASAAERRSLACLYPNLRDRDRLSPPASPSRLVEVEVA